MPAPPSPLRGPAKLLQGHTSILLHPALGVKGKLSKPDAQAPRCISVLSGRVAVGQVPPEGTCSSSCSRDSERLSVVVVPLHPRGVGAPNAPLPFRSPLRLLS